MSFLVSYPREARKPLAEVLPDGRKRITRYFKPTTTGTIPPELAFTPGTADPWTASTDGAPAGWTGLLSTYVQMRDSERGFPQGAEDDKPIVQVIFEQISATGETQTGGTPQTQLPSDRQQVEFTYVMFSSSTYTPQVPGVTTAPTPFTSYYLWEETTEDDGTLRNIKRTYQTAGTVSTDDESLQGGALLLKKIESFHTVPATPAGYASVGTPVQNPNGYPIYTYTFAKGNGEVSRRYVDAQGGTTPFNATTPSSSVGALRCIITYLTDKSVTSNPTTGPTSFVFIGQEIEDRDGYRVWNVSYGYGAGLITDDTDIRVAGGWVLYHRIQFGSAPTTPSATIGGTVTLFQSETRNSDGYVIYDYRWTEGHTTTATALGSGLVVNDVQTSASGALVIYHRIQFGGAPTAPTATIGGTVTLFENNQRQEAGFIIYDYRWAEGSGQANITTTGEPDGAIVYSVTDYGAASATPAYPGGIDSTHSLISVTNKPENGYFINTAVYKKWPASVGFRKMVKFFMPGLASISGSPILYSQEPPVTMDILATVTVDYGTTQITTTPFTVSAYAKLNAQWIPYTNPGTSPTPGSPPSDTTTGPPQGYTESLGGYLAGASGTTATNQYFNGVFVATYTYTLSSSTPSTRPSGATTIAVDNDPYLVDTSGTMVYRRTVTTYSF